MEKRHVRGAEGPPSWRASSRGHSVLGHRGLLAPHEAQEGETVRELKRVQRCVGKEGPLMDAKAACALLDSECRERVDLTRSPAVEDRYLRSPDDPSR